MLTWHWLLSIAAFSSLAVFCRWEMSIRSATGLLRVSSNAKRAIVLSAAPRAYHYLHRGKQTNL